MQTIIDIEKVSFAYRGSPVLQEVSLKVMAGEFIGVIGPNGGGKTTLFKLILGLLSPPSGTITVFGSTPKAARRLIGYVPQTLNFDRQFPISVHELVLTGRLSNISWWGSFSSHDKQLAVEAIAQVGLVGKECHPLSSLSGGQLQRALIARALVSKAQLLLLDEPTANLDAEGEVEVYNLLQQLRKEGVTTLMVTHDLNTVISQVERVIVVQGKAWLLKPSQVCDHFTVGLYHTPLIDRTQHTIEKTEEER